MDYRWFSITIAHVCTYIHSESYICTSVDPQVTTISKLDLMPNFSMIEKVVQQVCSIDYLVSKYTLLLINQFIQRQSF